jgi:hypothetical protein
LLVLLAAACGGEEPRIPRDLAEQLSGLSDAAAAAGEGDPTEDARALSAWLRENAG